MIVSQAYELALQRHRAGRLADAETLYRQILAAQPNHADSLHLLGLIAHQVGRDGQVRPIRDMTRIVFRLGPWIDSGACRVLN